jgi:hypothetical protein
MLVEIDDSGTPWELSTMTHESYPHRGTGSIVGPGVVAKTTEESLRLAQAAAAELLRFGMIEVRRGHDWHKDEGTTVGGAEAAALISDQLTWKWPSQPERDVYAWFALTPAGTEAAQRVSLDDIPSVPLPPTSLRNRIGSVASGALLRFLLRLLGWLGRLRSRYEKTR